MLPMTLGANIGTTFTALLAALAVPTHDSLQIAFCGSRATGDFTGSGHG
jgi:Na+/phosphate symporter